MRHRSPAPHGRRVVSAAAALLVALVGPAVDSAAGSSPPDDGAATLAAYLDANGSDSARPIWHCPLVQRRDLYEAFGSLTPGWTFDGARLLRPDESSAVPNVGVSCDYVTAESGWITEISVAAVDVRRSGADAAAAAGVGGIIDTADVAGAADTLDVMCDETTCAGIRRAGDVVVTVRVAVSEPVEDLRLVDGAFDALVDLVLGNLAAPDAMLTLADDVAGRAADTVEAFVQRFAAGGTVDEACPIVEPADVVTFVDSFDPISSRSLPAEFVVAVEGDAPPGEVVCQMEGADDEMSVDSIQVIAFDMSTAWAGAATATLAVLDGRPAAAPAPLGGEVVRGCTHPLGSGCMVMWRNDRIAVAIVFGISTFEPELIRYEEAFAVLLPKVLEHLASTAG